MMPSADSYAATESTTTASGPTTVSTWVNRVLVSARPSRVDSHASIAAALPTSTGPPTRVQRRSSCRAAYASANRCWENAVATASGLAS